MSEPRTEAIEPEEPEVAEDPTALTTQEPMTDDGMDAVIAVAAKMGAYEKAMDTITNAIIKRSYPGDWVCHAKASDKSEDRKANIGSAAAERIAMFLGIQERNWTPGLKTRSDDGKHFTWTFEAEFGFGKRWIHAVGRASSQDKFFGYAYGQWKALEDVKEDDVRMAAFRACRKEGVRGLLGLRGIPITKLKELGYNVDQVRYANFEEKGKALDAEAKAVNKDTGLAEREIIIGEIQPKEGITKERAWRLLNIRDKGGTMWTMWSAPGGKGHRESLLKHSLESGTSVKIQFQTKKTDRGDQYEIIKVNGEIDGDNGGSK